MSTERVGEAKPVISQLSIKLSTEPGLLPTVQWRIQFLGTPSPVGEEEEGRTIASLPAKGAGDEVPGMKYQIH